ncbi:hypothetical protein [Planomonospora sp. ID82291]|uniref:hypothetical protein n=1 Tax=Planomonospora sp. ID82291 TaxID=2738136 RepID=UPI0018C436FE|nr:hypothetical protein [Planomonospora sp. ID82291]MBG0818711.1 hypothetical protein [Planomonospora sp. ID82291]
MSGRRMRIYGVAVTYPEGSDRPGWRPPGWHDRHTLWIDFSGCVWDGQAQRCNAEVKETAGNFGSDYDRVDEDGRFRWPKERHFLSKRAAERRVALFESFGADAELVVSDPVTWPAAQPREEVRAGG